MPIFKSIFHAIGVAGSAVGHFFANAFTWVEKDGAKIAVAILEDLKVLFDSGATNFVAQIIDGLTKSNIPSEILALLQKELPKALAVGLAVEGLPSNPTDQDVQDFANRVLTAFGVTADKSKFYSTLAADITGIIRSNTAPGQKFTFAVLIQDVEQAYKDYIAAKAQQDAEAA